MKAAMFNVGSSVHSEGNIMDDVVAWKRTLNVFEEHWTCVGDWMGYSTSPENVHSVRKFLEKATSCSFAGSKDLRVNYSIDLDNVTVLLDDSKDPDSFIAFDNVPFLKLGDPMYYTCQGGTKEAPCPAMMTVKVVLKCPQIHVKSNDECLREMVSNIVKQELLSGETGEVRYYLKLPPPSSHQHHTGEKANVGGSNNLHQICDVANAKEQRNNGDVQLEESVDINSSEMQETQSASDVSIETETLHPLSNASSSAKKSRTGKSSSNFTVYKCNECNYTTESHANLYKHKVCHRAKKTHQCSQCDYTCRTASNLKRHEATHLNLRMFHCDYCNKRFSQKAHLNTHMKRCHTNKKFVCSGCSTGFQTKRDLDAHMRNEHRSTLSGPAREVKGPDGASHYVYECQNNAFICQYCNISFDERRGLQQHEKLHIAGPEMKYYCTDCSFITNSVSKLERHKLIHSGIKPYQCGLCPFRSNQKEHVVRHIRAKHSTDDKKQQEAASVNVENINRSVLEQDIIQKIEQSQGQVQLSALEGQVQLSALEGQVQLSALEGQVQLSALDPAAETEVMNQFEHAQNVIFFDYAKQPRGGDTKTTTYSAKEMVYYDTSTKTVYSGNEVMHSNMTGPILCESTSKAGCSAVVSSNEMNYTNATYSANEPVLTELKSVPMVFEGSSQINTGRSTVASSNTDGIITSQTIPQYAETDSANKSTALHVIDNKLPGATNQILGSTFTITNQSASFNINKSSQSANQNLYAKRDTANQSACLNGINASSKCAVASSIVASLVTASHVYASPVETSPVVASQVFAPPVDHSGHVKIPLSSADVVPQNKGIVDVSQRDVNLKGPTIVTPEELQSGSNAFHQRRTVVKPKFFGCNFCSMTFAKLLNLYKHLHTMHKDRMVREGHEMKCVVCSYIAPSKKSLLSHMRHHTNYEHTYETKT